MWDWNTISQEKNPVTYCSEYDRVIDAAGQDDQHAPQKTCVVAAHRLDEPVFPHPAEKYDVHPTNPIHVASPRQSRLPARDSRKLPVPMRWPLLHS